MANLIVIILVVVTLYLLLCYLLYPVVAAMPKTDADKSDQEKIASPAVDDIMGKSTFDVNAELRRIRQHKEEEARKTAIAKGEMTENGEEIAQEVSPEDCEVEPKKVWKQVSTEQLDEMFGESEDNEEPYAQGATIDDIDLAFKTSRKQNPTSDEVRHAADTFSQLNDTVLMDNIKKLLPEVNSDIDRVMKMYSGELKDARTVKAPKKTSRSLKPMSFPERFEDFKVSDIL